jgi:site-specific DNA-cytosine methylase
MERRRMSVRIVHDTHGLFSSGDVTNRPMPTVLSSPRDAGHYKIHFTLGPEPAISIGKPKPPYRVPLMAELATYPWNGLKVASTFSGAGGSCTGYRMAGYRVVWANEFVPVAQESYRANWPDSILDGRDIHQVQAAEILAATGLAEGELDLFDGSPPCQAFSSAGKREKGWGEAKRYEHGAEQCNETLFGEYVRLVKGLKPRVLVAENVSGLVKGMAKGWFIDVMKALKACGYCVSARLLDAQWLGVPQARQRIIFVGVREDLKRQPAHPRPLSYCYSVREGVGLVEEQQPGARKLTIDEVKAICGFPADYVLCGTYAQQWERLGNSVPPVMMKTIAETIRDKVLYR